MKWKFEITLPNILIILGGTALNVLGSLFAGTLKLPIWLDSIGTFVSAVLLGPVAGALSGFLMNLIFSFFRSNDIWFSLVSIAGGIAVGCFFPRDRKIESFSIIATALFAGFVMSVVCTPLNMIFNNGYTGNMWGDALVNMISKSLDSRVICCLLGGLFVNMPDKALSIGITMLLVALIRRIPKERSNGIEKQN